MPEGNITIQFHMVTDHVPKDPATYWLQVGQTIVEGIPDDWFHETEEVLHITQMRIHGIQVGMLEDEEEE